MRRMRRSRGVVVIGRMFRSKDEGYVVHTIAVNDPNEDYNLIKLFLCHSPTSVTVHSRGVDCNNATRSDCDSRPVLDEPEFEFDLL